MCTFFTHKILSWKIHTGKKTSVKINLFTENKVLFERDDSHFYTGEFNFSIQLKMHFHDPKGQISNSLQLIHSRQIHNKATTGHKFYF